ncbi:hypothetical protein [Paenibacillus mendelii]|uniref:DUF3889 domain-containing protein n=1 Tax=Paenibacillus mendelii TaxID=206163 RepID=A0ABV6JMK9_9BACL|nr:hypothetical protein [Paenibacillus mendelii]MCQ6563998.1 hypothetical protein [Paenibacillus mendelii]
MLKQILLYLSTAMLLFGVVACTQDRQVPDELVSLREAAWNSIDGEHQKQVDGDWKNAKVENAKSTEMPIPKGGGKIKKVQHIYKVTFNTKKDARLSSLKVFIDGDTNEPLSSLGTIK